MTVSMSLFSMSWSKRWNAGRSHLFPQVGYRDEHQDAADPTGVVTPETEERLYSLTWDASQAFAKGISIETSGLIWWRRKGLPSDTTLVPPDAQLSAAQLQLRRDNAWTEGNVYVALRWAPKLVISAGYEFTTNAQEEHNTHHFFNGSILWNITSSTSLTLFGGGNRPGLKCVSGVCRVFPAFEGVRLELVVRL